MSVLLYASIKERGFFFDHSFFANRFVVSESAAISSRLVFAEANS